MSGKVVRYSEAFKMQVVSDLEEGRFRSPFEASRSYGIGGAGTVQGWVKKYGKGHLLRKVVTVSKPNEPSELKRLNDRVRQLESALADAYMDQALERASFELLCEQTKTDGTAFKKKHGVRASSTLGRASDILGK